MLCAQLAIVTKKLIHLFVECRHVTDLWLKLKKLGWSNVAISLGKRDIIFGVEYTDHVVHLCILVSQFVTYIYRCKLGDKLPTFPTVKAYQHHGFKT
jgi:hypothetical protein